MSIVLLVWVGFSFVGCLALLGIAARPLPRFETESLSLPEPQPMRAPGKQVTTSDSYQPAFSAA